MSSPSNLVVIITHVEMDDSEFQLQAAAYQEAWTATLGEYRDRKTHTDAAIDQFFWHAATGRGLIDGAEGKTFSFAVCGNYVNSNDFVHAIEPFVRELVSKLTYTSVTVMFQPHDVNVTAVYKLDGTRLLNPAPDLQLVPYEAPVPAFSFDVELEKLPVSDFQGPVLGPTDPYPPAREAAVKDLIQALSATYGPAGDRVLTQSSLEGVMFPPKAELGVPAHDEAYRLLPPKRKP